MQWNCMEFNLLNQVNDGADITALACAFIYGVQACALFLVTRQCVYCLKKLPAPPSPNDYKPFCLQFSCKQCSAR